MPTPKGSLTPTARRVLVDALKRENNDSVTPPIKMWGKMMEGRLVLGRHTTVSPHPKTVLALESKGLLVMVTDKAYGHYGGAVEYKLTEEGRKIAEDLS